MTISNIISLLENNYEEIDLFDHIDNWQKWSMSDNTVYSLCQVRNDLHNLIIQALVEQETEEKQLPERQVIEIYISYKDETINVKKAFAIKEDSVERLIYQDLLDIDTDMNWRA